MGTINILSYYGDWWPKPITTANWVYEGLPEAGIHGTQVGTVWNGYCYYRPVVIPWKVTIDKLCHAHHLALGAAANFKVGIYDTDDTTFKPKNLKASATLAQADGSGAVHKAKWATLTASVALNPGVYWLAFLPDTDLSGKFAVCSDFLNFRFLHAATAIGTAVYDDDLSCWVQNIAYASGLPDPAGTLTACDPVSYEVDAGPIWQGMHVSKVWDN